MYNVYNVVWSVAMKTVCGINLDAKYVFLRFSCEIWKKRSRNTSANKTVFCFVSKVTQQRLFDDLYYKVEHRM